MSDRLRGAWVVNGTWWWTLRAVDPDGVVRLVGAILAGTPSLPGAACRGRYDLFDEVPRTDAALRQERARASVGTARWWGPLLRVDRCWCPICPRTPAIR